MTSPLLRPPFFGHNTISVFGAGVLLPELVPKYNVLQSINERDGYTKVISY
mgnify:FL=1